MGRRHLAGLAELPRTSYLNCGLLAVCDPNERNAGDLADEAHELLGEHPAAEPLRCAIHGVERGGLRPVDSVASIGAGALGLPVLSVA
jgi:threonine dehydrogenase-like Zn-dependent dehydrogenase